MITKRSIGILFVGALAALGVGLSFRSPFRPQKSPPLVISSQLDQWLEDSERAVPGLRPQTEKKILWAKDRGVPTELSLVYLHGFSASRREISPVVEEVGKQLKANIFFTRLRQHGLSGEALATAKAQQWIDDVREAVAIGNAIGRRVALIGTSTGATLSLFAAMENPSIDSLVLISPNFAPKDSRAKWVLWPAGLWLAKMIAGSWRSWTPHNELQKEVWTYSYPLEAIVPVMQIVEWGESLDLKSIKTKVLTLYTPHDQTIDPTLIPKRFNQLGTSKKKIVRLEAVKEHVLVGDAIQSQANQQVVQQVIEFLDRP